MQIDCQFPVHIYFLLSCVLRATCGFISLIFPQKGKLCQITSFDLHDVLLLTSRHTWPSICSPALGNLRIALPFALVSCSTCVRPFHPMSRSRIVLARRNESASRSRIVLAQQRGSAQAPLRLASPLFQVKSLNTTATLPFYSPTHPLGRDLVSCSCSC